LSKISFEGGYSPSGRSPVSSETKIAPGHFLGRYECIRPIARGGMAEVYVARYKAAGGAQKIVAIKRVLPHYADDPDFLAMFRNETRIAATLDHPNIVQVFDFDESAEEHFIAMEYVHGVTLRDVLRSAASGAGLPLQCALTIITGIAQGLHYAHEACGTDGRPLGLVHRDVSPTNVLLTYDGAVKIVDFGIAKATTKTRVTRTGTLKGKPSYMSPEQCRVAEIDRRSDVFTLGILLYEATTLRRLFSGPNDYAIMNMVAAAEFARPSEIDEDYPPQLEAIVLGALQRDPDRRYTTARAMQADLEAFAAAQGLSLSPLALADHIRRNFDRPSYPTADWTVPGIATQAERSPAGRVALRTAAVGVAALALAAGGYVIGGLSRAAPAPSAAKRVAAPVPASEPEVEPDPEPAPEPAPAAPTPASAEPGAATPTREPTGMATDAPEPASPTATRRRRPKRTKKPATPPLRGNSELLPPSGRVD
jgi:serine/threonine protein kinase